MFDSFVAHNIRDRPAVRRLVRHLRARKINLWYSEDEVPPGRPWIPKLQEGIADSRTVMVLVGEDGIGPWQQVEIETALMYAVERGLHVIPVLLPGQRNVPELPTFLRLNEWVDCRGGFRRPVLDRLVLGIVGRKPATPIRLPALKHRRPRKLTWGTVLKAWLAADFNWSGNDDVRGYFGRMVGSEGLNDQARPFQSERGDLTGSKNHPKRPYYVTYWGYRAAARIAPEKVGAWGKITADSIRGHLAKNRWIVSDRKADGPLGRDTAARVGETVRHTVRAAQLLRILCPEDHKIAEVERTLVYDANTLQHMNGGWAEYIGDFEPPELWSSVYVFAFLSSLTDSQIGGTPKERVKFRSERRQLLSRTEAYLADSLVDYHWSQDSPVPWQDNVPVVYAELAGFLTRVPTIRHAYELMLSTVSPSGTIRSAIRTSDPPEHILALRLAYSLGQAGRRLRRRDLKCGRLRQWLAHNFSFEKFSTQDVLFAADVLDMKSECPPTVRQSANWLD